MRAILLALTLSGGLLLTGRCHAFVPTAQRQAPFSSSSKRPASAPKRGEKTSAHTRSKLSADVDAFVAAGGSGDLLQLQKLLQQGMPIDASTEAILPEDFVLGKDGCTALHNAVLHKQDAAVAYLLAKGANPNSRGVRLERPNSCLVADTLAVGYTPIMAASLQDSPTCLKIILENGGSVNAIFEGRSFVGMGFSSNPPVRVNALSLAVGAHAKRCVELLIQHGANVNVLDPSWGTPLVVAATNGDTRIVELLLKAGSRLNAQESFTGNTALLAAVFRKDVESVKLLLKYGADVRIKDHSGYDALSAAAAVSPECETVIKEALRAK